MNTRPRLTDDAKRRIVELTEQGVPAPVIAERLRVSKDAVNAYKRRMGLSKPRKTQA